MLFVTIFLILLVNTVSSDFSIDQSIYKFSVSTFKDTNTANGNFIVSPISAQIVLGLAYAGSSGPTAQAMNTGLDLIGQTQQKAIDDFQALITLLNQVDSSTTLDIANKIYINNTFTLSPSFQGIASQFNSDVQTIDFSDNVDAANAINAWASQETGGNIQNVVDSSNFNSNTAMVLLNAIYFKGVWETQFDPSQTNLGTFNPSSSTTQRIPFMNVQSNFIYGYVRTLRSFALQLMYTDPSLSMLFILPGNADALPQTISLLSSTNINSILNDMYTTQVVVSIPKFTINSNINLNNALMQMGMGIIFGPEADFTNMVTQLPPNEFLYVDSVSQNALIEVNEQGATAAAVTVVSVRRGNLPAPPPPSPPSFYADHPFLFMILKNAEPLFIGSFVRGDVPVVGNEPVEKFNNIGKPSLPVLSSSSAGNSMY